MRVGVDVCNTISNVNLELLRYYNISFEDYPSPQIPEGFFNTAKGLDIFMKAEPFPGSQGVLKGLCDDGYLVEYVTTRPAEAEFITKRWLALHGFPPGRVIFVGSPEEKVQYAIRKGHIVFFDDDPRVAALFLNTRVDVFVKDWQYNRSLDSGRLIRFKKWSEIAARDNARLGL